MPQFHVDEDLAALVERLAEPKPFEHLSFNNALWRVLNNFVQLAAKKPSTPDIDADKLLAEAMTFVKARKAPKKMPSPSAKEWAASIPELKGKPEITNWQSICDLFNLKTGGDSARRRLQKWVKQNRPSWPHVPEIVGD